jgi:hypothetical protein
MQTRSSKRKQAQPVKNDTKTQEVNKDEEKEAQRRTRMIARCLFAHIPKRGDLTPEEELASKKREISDNFRDDIPPGLTIADFQGNISKYEDQIMELSEEIAAQYTLQKAQNAHLLPAKFILDFTKDWA